MWQGHVAMTRDKCMVQRQWKRARDKGMERECGKGMGLYGTRVCDKASPKGMGHGTGACVKGMGHETRAWTRAWDKGMGQGYVACACGKGMWQGHGASAWGKSMG